MLRFNREYVCYAMVAWLCLVLFLPTSDADNGCDVTVRSTLYGPKVHAFSSPNFPHEYGSNLICFYKFIGLPGERLYLNFTYIDIKGIPPRCHKDYIDVYTQLYEESDLYQLLDVPVYGRFCGSFLDRLPHLIVSMHNLLVVGFFTDASKNATGFRGFVNFVTNDMYNMGTPEPLSQDVCGYTINSVSRSNGTIIAPTYPGVYPDNVFCYYKLSGIPGQRIRLTFLDFDMFEGGEHCPYDSLKIYDGQTNEAPLVATLCGKHSNLQIFSTYESLHIEFRTKSGRPKSQKKEYRTYWELEPGYEIKRRGFKAFYEFSDQFVNLGRFVNSENAFHIRGTECDQVIRSKGESNGTLASPNFPGQYPQNTSCFYFLDGLKDSQRLEKVKVTMNKLDMPKFARCSSAKVSFYLDGQSPVTSSPNRVLCGSALPRPMFSSNPRLVVEFNSSGGQISGTGFNLSYTFIKDFAIPGTPIQENKCHFVYLSSRHKSGVFNSPRHPLTYPSDMDCVYEFRALPGEGTMVSFSTFRFFGFGKTGDSCTGDWLEVYHLMPDPSNSSLTSDLFYQRYCGNDDASPGPIPAHHSAVGLKLVFHSNNDTHSDNGFKAYFMFMSHKTDKACTEVLDRGIGGVIESPSFPDKYTTNLVCDWTIVGVQPLHHVLLHFVNFNVEVGDGCQNAALRVFTGGGHTPDYELCGDLKSLNQSSNLALLLSTNRVRLSFTTSSFAQGKKGFKISWSEILRNKYDFCNDFECERSGLCISKNLTCNGVPNCGLGDNSDENADCGATSLSPPLWFSLFCVVSLLEL